jgi:hypothetical protein
MDLFDFASPPPGGRGLGENVSSILAFPVLPFLAFLIATESLGANGTLLGVVLPCGFAGLVYFLGRRLGGRAGYVALCAVGCLLASLFAVLLGTFFALF